MITNEKLSINTVEGWSNYAEVTNTKSFIHEMGREPHDYAEVTSWVKACVEAALALSGPDSEPEETLTVMDGQYWFKTKL